MLNYIEKYLENRGDVMKLTKVKDQPLLIVTLAVVTIIPLFGLGLSARNLTVSNPPVSVSENPAMPQSADQQATAPTIKTHTVSQGETLSTIAEKYNLDVDSLLGANPNAGEMLQPGDQLVILPQKGVLHTVDMGDTLWRIANLYGVDISTILTANSKTNDRLTIGEKLFVPGGKLLARAEAGAIPVSRSSVSRFSWPAQGEFTSPFGRRWGRLHAGIDIANDVGTPVRAAMAGRVTYTGWYGGYGYTVMMEHNNGYSTLYGHLDNFAVSPGQNVKAGQRIGSMGNTGYSTGPHLHFEVHKDGTAIDPMNVLP